MSVWLRPPGIFTKNAWRGGQASRLLADVGMLSVVIRLGTEREWNGRNASDGAGRRRH